ncbi:hypothetical protein [Mycolicibacterium llatzerense]|uniref:hypothetical protein n=1 Tax=Mycolicibacterium llatzerense TaxID=280871 RepID=UPI0021B517AF|nr:hypothetical protein [Mycolicibacterium llatzerense]MCT7373387.1 hypothetical protein [Mycolicibacterium llatzerense]
MPSDTVRLIVHATCFLTVFVGYVVLIALEKIEPTTALTFIVTTAGLISPALSMAKLVQDRRGADQSSTPE